MTHVDGAETRLWSPDTLRHALQGVAGTMCEIKFLKGGKESSSVFVKRGSSAYWQTSEERDSLKKQLDERTQEMLEKQVQSREELRTAQAQAGALESQNASLLEQLQKEKDEKHAASRKLDDVLAELTKTKTMLAASQRTGDDLNTENGVLRQQADGAYISS